MNTGKITRCPQCNTSFRISEEQLQIAEGTVRCGSCLTVFQAESYLQEQSSLQGQSSPPGQGSPQVQGSQQEKNSQQGPDSPQNQVSKQDQDSPQIQGSQNVPGSPQIQGSQQDQGVPQGQSGLSAQDMSDQDPYGNMQAQQRNDISDQRDSTFSSGDHRQAIPQQPVNQSRQLQVDPLQYSDDNTSETFVQTENTAGETAIESSEPRSRNVFLRIVGILLLLLLGIAQYGWFNFDQIVMDDRFRSYFLEACQYLECSLPDYNNPQALTTENLQVSSHPYISDALIVDAMVRNSAQFKQRFPSVKLQFQNRNGGLVASRIFTIDEYLGSKLRDIEYIPPKTEVRFAMEILDPGSEVIEYEMSVVVPGAGD